MTLYLIDHRHWIDDEYYDTKLIGTYSSNTNVLTTIEKYSQLSGFCDFKDGFHVETFEVQMTQKKLDKGIVYLLTNTQMIDEYDNITISYRICLNKFVSRILWIIKSIKSCTKKKNKRNKFYVNESRINESDWREGFVTIE